MSNEAKLLALLAEARESLFDLGERSASAYERGDRGSVKEAEREKAELHARIDAALSEPETLSDCARKGCEYQRAAEAMGAALTKMGDERNAAQSALADLQRLGQDVLRSGGHPTPEEWGAAFALGWLEGRLEEAQAEVLKLRKLLAEARDALSFPSGYDDGLRPLPERISMALWGKQ